MMLSYAMLFTGLLIILSGCSIDSYENDVYISNEYIKTDNHSELIKDSNNNNKLGIVKKSADTEEVDIANFEKIAQLNNGEELYYDGGGFYYKTEFGENIVIKRNSEIKVICKGFPSRPKLSPNGRMVAFIDYVGFEVMGNLFVYDIETKNKRKETSYDYRQDDTVKALEWLDDDHILLIIGSDIGTVTQGGNLYIYDMNEGELEMILSAEEHSEFTDVMMNGADIKLTIVVWTDDNYTEYEYIEKEIPIKELIRN